MKAAILSIGDELVLGQTIDSNSAFISAKLAELGIATLQHRTLSDDFADIVDGISQLANSADILIISGGIGPTEDDLTRQALAKAMGVNLQLDNDSLCDIEQYFKQRNRPVSETNKRQAMLPKGAKPITNQRGTAVGIMATFNGASIYVTPGVPHEMKAMIENDVLVDIQENLGQNSAEQGNSQGAIQNTILTEKINTFGIGESTVAEKLGKLMDRKRNPRVGTTVAKGLVSIRIRSEFAGKDEAQEQLNSTIKQIYNALGAAIFSHSEKSLGAATSELLLEHNLTVAVAESCTGGLLGAMLSETAGVSAIYKGGWITYSNEMKINALGVDKNEIEQHGAVSEQVAKQMAEAALEKSGSDLALSITGIAGPGGGTKEKPVGTVYIALAMSKQYVNHEKQTQVMRLRLSGDRQTIRDRAAKSALQMLRLRVLGKPLDIISHGKVV